MALTEVPSARSSRRGVGRVAFIALVTGIVAGALVAAIAAYRIIWGEAFASVVLAPMVGVVWVIAAYRVARRDELRAGILTVLVAGVIAALIGSLADTYLAHTFIDVYVMNTNAALPPGSPDTVTAFDLLSREPNNIAMSVVAILLSAGMLGALGAMMGVGSGGIVSEESALRTEAEAELPYEYGARSPNEIPGDDPHRGARVGEIRGTYGPIQSELPRTDVR